MLVAAIDIHRHVFQAAVLDPESGEVVEARFSADRSSLVGWVEEWRGRVSAVAIEATTGWRWVWRELATRGFDVRLAEPVQARALLGRSSASALRSRVRSPELAAPARLAGPESRGSPRPSVALPSGQQLRLRLDGSLPHLSWEAATHPLAVLGQRKPHNLPDPELDPAVHEHLIAARKRLRDRMDLVSSDHDDPTRA